ncbi:MAG: Na+/H+ antiporter subunit C [Thermoflexales bacterium]|nr:Na+/H+ antiporter subunit C [Thermoflexales bacterium]
MEIVMAIVIGVLFAAGVYMLLRRSVVKLIIGLGLLSHGANLLLFTMGPLRRGRVPILDEAHAGYGGALADPLPQALILTAIVIGFGVSAFVLVLAYRASQATGHDDLDELRTTDQ